MEPEAWISAIEKGKLPIQGEHTIPLCRSPPIIAAAPVRKLNLSETTSRCYCHKSLQNVYRWWWALLLKQITFFLLLVSPATTGTSTTPRSTSTNDAVDYHKTKLCNTTEKLYRSVNFVKKQTFLYFIGLFDEKNTTSINPIYTTGLIPNQ